MKSIIARFAHKTSAVTTVVLTALLFATSSLPVHAQATDVEALASVTQPLGEAYVVPEKLAPNIARVIFYRPAYGYAAGVSSVQINDSYHTSLQFGGFSELCVPPGRVSLASHMVQTGAQLKKFPDATANVVVTAGQNVYFRINEYGDNRAVITPMAEDAAKAELQNTRRQIHAISRIPNKQDCVPVEATPAPVTAAVAATQEEQITLGADTLFAFGKSDIKDISTQGRTALDKLVVHLQKDYGNQDDIRVDITGHADPLGKPVANQRLSNARAQAIRTYMVSRGMNPKHITAAGAGSEQPLVTTCGKTATPATIECNKPNRRVVVNVQVLAR